MKLPILIFSLTFLSYSIFPQTPSKKKWSPNFGIMNWHEAKKKCESVKMWLPTLSELKNAYLDKEMILWNNDKEDLLWSSNSVNDDESAKSFSASEGYELTTWKVQPKNSGLPNLPPPEELTSVRCIQFDFKGKDRKSGIVWSQYLGEMSWEAANQKCKELKMKLPTIKQFKAAIQSREFENTVQGSYWSSELDKQTTDKKYYAYFVHWTNYHSFVSEPTESNHVRCAK